jgi:hypothetical protein
MVDGHLQVYLSTLLNAGHCPISSNQSPIPYPIYQLLYWVILSFRLVLHRFLYSARLLLAQYLHRTCIFAELYSGTTDPGKKNSRG